MKIHLPLRSVRTRLLLLAGVNDADDLLSNLGL